MDFKRQKLSGGFNRITLALALLLPTGALIYVNFSQLRTFSRDKVLQATVRREFQEILSIDEKEMSKKTYAKVDEAREMFPSPGDDQEEKEEKLRNVLMASPWLAHAFFYDEDELVFQSQPGEENDKFVRDEREYLSDSYEKWLSGKEGKHEPEFLSKKPHRLSFGGGQTKRADGPAYLLTAVFLMPDVPLNQVVIGGVVFDPCYMKSNFFPEMLERFVNDKTADQGGNRIAMIIYPTDQMDMNEIKPLVASTGWGDGKPEVKQKLENFPGLSMAIKYQGVSVEALAESWVRNSFVLLGILSLMTIGGIFLTKHIVSKEMAVARLKSDFVSNVSHELRTPLALIRLYAETLELGRITTKEKKHRYYRIIRKESERLTALINNILDFSRIEAGRKEYEFRETDIADLVRNTLDSYRYQIEQQGFALEESIDEDLPAVRIDREAIARALVNLVNNALKYSKDDKYLGVKLYRDNGSVKLEVADHGIGIARRDQAKIFEKFYRAGDPLVHNTKGSGLGLSLVRHITEAHGGAIEVESSPGAGSKFIVSLPLVAAVHEHSQAASTSVQQQAI
jgi:signal transduction histidine kinase